MIAGIDIVKRSINKQKQKKKTKSGSGTQQVNTVYCQYVLRNCISMDNSL
jgi:hypothetical protein